MTNTEEAMRFTVSARYHHPMEIVELFKRYDALDQLSHIFGFLSESPLNGGRPRGLCKPFSMEVIDTLNDLGVGYSFTLTNTTVAQEHLEEPYTNSILKRFERSMNGVIVANDQVAQYIRAMYPGYRLRASCIYDYLEADEINDACGVFDQVCVFPEVNDNVKTLTALKEPEKVVLFGTSACLNLCGRNRAHHYYILGQDHIAYYNHKKYGTSYHERDYYKPKMPWCVAEKSRPKVHDMKRLFEMGFTTFKITQPDLFESVHFKGEDAGGFIKWHAHPLNPLRTGRVK